MPSTHCLCERGSRQLLFSLTAPWAVLQWARQRFATEFHFTLSQAVLLYMHHLYIHPCRCNTDHHAAAQLTRLLRKRATVYKTTHLTVVMKTPSPPGEQRTAVSGRTYWHLNSKNAAAECQIGGSGGFGTPPRRAKPLSAGPRWMEITDLTLLVPSPPRPRPCTRAV